MLTSVNAEEAEQVNLTEASLATHKTISKNQKDSQACGRTYAIPAFMRDSRRIQPCLHTKFQASHSYKARLYLRKKGRNGGKEAGERRRGGEKWRPAL